MKTYRLSKSKVLSGLQCPKRLYLEIHHPDFAEVSDAVERMFSNGHLVGDIARRSLPEGRLIGSADDLKAALSETKAELKSGRTKTLFEPAFQHGGVLVRADIFSRRGSTNHVVEVKSSTSVKDYHLRDAAIQHWVISGAGYALDSVSIAHIDNAFVYQGNGDYRGLLKQVDVTGDIVDYIGQVPAWVEGMQQMLAEDMPDIGTGAHCHDPFECPFLGYCSRGQPEFPVDLLPRGRKAAERLRASGYDDLRKVPETLLDNAKHKRVWKATVTGEPEFDPRAAGFIRNLDYPRFYLDFETIQFAVPIWAGTRPYEQLPFQWSCHIEGRGNELQHREFLDVSGEPPMRSFAERLIATVGDRGAILVYGHFEARILKELSERFPDLESPLSGISKRLVNLHPITEEHYYHPAMKGSWSLKAVLPTIASDLDYDRLGEVQDGGAAQDAYIEIISPATSDERRTGLEKDLRAYCGRDTEGLVRLARFILNI